MASTGQNTTISAEQTAARSKKPMNSKHDKLKKSVVQKAAEKDAALAATKNQMIAGDGTEEAQVVTKPLPKKGDHNYSIILHHEFLPAEIRKTIYRFLVVFNKPILLTEDGRVLQKHFARHLTECPYSAGDNLAHQKLFSEAAREKFHHREARDGDKERLVPNFIYDLADGFCTDPITKENTKVPVPETVLKYRLMCKQINEELTPIFWQENKFAFYDADDMHQKLTGLFKHAQSMQLKYPTFDSGHSVFIRNIRKASLFFSPKKAHLYAQIAEHLPGLMSMDIIIYHDSPLLTFDKQKAVAGRGKNPLSLAKHIDTCAIAFNKFKTCKLINEVNVVGTDLVRLLTPSEDESYLAKADINSPGAIGPVIRANILKVQEPWLSGEQLKEKEEEKKRREAEEKLSKEKAKKARNEKAKRTREANKQKKEEEAERRAAMLQNGQIHLFRVDPRTGQRHKLQPFEAMQVMGRPQAQIQAAPPRLGQLAQAQGYHGQAARTHGLQAQPFQPQQYNVHIAQGQNFQVQGHHIQQYHANLAQPQGFQAQGQQALNAHCHAVHGAVNNGSQIARIQRPPDQSLFGGPANPQPAPTGQSYNGHPWNAPPGYGPFQGHTNSNNNFGGFNHQG